ncbi:MAG: PilZ domain-containing protein [Oscillibacter sp.]|jgi:hypothetical protein|nr:PilZ domain-containing protein [Oscillibacter sp.]
MTTANQDSSTYLILDSANTPLAHGKMETPPGSTPMRMLVLEAKVDDVMEHGEVNLVGMGSSDLPMRCRVLRQRGDRVLLEKLGTLDGELRRNLRVPVQFDTFLYPLDGAWTGRRTARSLDLSCGGIAFLAEDGLELHDRAEIVVVPTEEPVLLRCEVLRKQEREGGAFFYATKFVDMCEDEEVAVREAVFSLQLQSSPRKPSANSQEVRK